jgi:hypothetical protein
MVMWFDYHTQVIKDYHTHKNKSIMYYENTKE